MEEDNFDPDDDAMSSDILVLTQEVEEEKGGTTCVLEAHITKHDDNNGVTWIKFYNKGSTSFSHCYVDTIDAELIVNAIANYVRVGRKYDVDTFLRTEGRVAMSPVAFRMKLEAFMNAGSVDETAGLF